MWKCPSINFSKKWTSLSIEECIQLANGGFHYIELQNGKKVALKNCKKVQDYLYDKPLPVEKMVKQYLEE